MISRRLIALFFLSYICQFVLAQDVELRTQLDVDLFDPATTIIQGDLEIGSAISDITNLSTLSNLQTVTGDLIIKDNPLLQSLSGLENLNSVINDFEIED